MCSDGNARQFSSAVVLLGARNNYTALSDWRLQNELRRLCACECGFAPEREHALVCEAQDFFEGRAASGRQPYPVFISLFPTLICFIHKRSLRVSLNFHHVGVWCWPSTPSVLSPPQSVPPASDEGLKSPKSDLLRVCEIYVDHFQTKGCESVSLFVPNKGGWFNNCSGLFSPPGGVQTVRQEFIRLLSKRVRSVHADMRTCAGNTVTSCQALCHVSVQETPAAFRTL